MLVTTILAATAVSALFAFAMSRLSVEVREGESVLVTRGRAVLGTYEKPGLHMLPFGQVFGTRVHRVSLRPQTCVGAAAWSARVIQVWLDYQVVQPRESFERMADLPTELKSAVLEHARHLLGEVAGLDAADRRDELNSAVLSAALPKAQWLGVQLHSVAVNLANLPRATQSPTFDLTGLPPLPRVTGVRS